MSNLQVSFPDNVREFVERRVASGSFRDVSAYLQSLVERDSLEEDRARIEALALEGFAEIERGECAEMTSEEWAQIRKEYLERARRRNGA